MNPLTQLLVWFIVAAFFSFFFSARHRRGDDDGKPKFENQNQNHLYHSQNAAPTRSHEQAYGEPEDLYDHVESGPTPSHEQADGEPEDLYDQVESGPTHSHEQANDEPEDLYDQVESGPTRSHKHAHDEPEDLYDQVESGPTHSHEHADDEPEDLYDMVERSPTRSHGREQDSISQQYKSNNGRKNDAGNYRPISLHSKAGGNPYRQDLYDTVDDEPTPYHGYGNGVPYPQDLYDTVDDEPTPYHGYENGVPYPQDLYDTVDDEPTPYHGYENGVQDSIYDTVDRDDLSHDFAKEDQSQVVTRCSYEPRKPLPLKPEYVTRRKESHENVKPDNSNNNEDSVKPVNVLHDPNDIYDQVESQEPVAAHSTVELDLHSLSQQSKTANIPTPQEFQLRLTKTGFFQRNFRRPFIWTIWRKLTFCFQLLVTRMCSKSFRMGTMLVILANDHDQKMPSDPGIFYHFSVIDLTVSWKEPAYYLSLFVAVLVHQRSMDLCGCMFEVFQSCFLWKKELDKGGKRRKS